MGERTGRITSLDGLRGVAALVVLIHHSLLVIPAMSAVYFNGTVPPSLLWLAYSPLHILWAGGEAVYVFFILSGFVLTLPILRRGSARWRSYYPSRLIRLYLPVVASVVLAAILAVLVTRTPMDGRSKWMELHSEPLTLANIIRDATLINPGWLNSPLWSLKWEVIFSLLLPAYLIVAAKTRRWWWVVALGSIALSTAGAVIGNGFITYLPMFMIGCSIAAGWDSAQLVPQRIWSVLLGCGLLGITAHWWVSPFIGRGEHLTLPVVLVSAATIVIASARWNGADTNLQRRPIQWLGRTSFSLYLVHEPIVVTIALLIPATYSWTVPLLSIPAALVAGAAFSRWVERPAHSAAKAVGRRFSSQTQVARS